MPKKSIRRASSSLPEMKKGRKLCGPSDCDGAIYFAAMSSMSWFMRLMKVAGSSSVPPSAKSA